MKGVATRLPLDHHVGGDQCLRVLSNCEGQRLDTVGEKVEVGRIANAFGVHDRSAGGIGVRRPVAGDDAEKPMLQRGQRHRRPLRSRVPANMLRGRPPPAGRVR